MVRLAPRIQMPCAVGAISTGAPARTATASPGPMPAAASPPATRRARSCTCAQVWRTGACGSPVFSPLVLDRALEYIVSVKTLMTGPYGFTSAEDDEGCVRMAGPRGYRCGPLLVRGVAGIRPL